MRYRIGNIVVTSLLQLPLEVATDLDEKSSFHVICHASPRSNIQSDSASFKCFYQGRLTVVENAFCGQCWIAEDNILHLFLIDNAKEEHVRALFSGPLFSIMCWKMGRVPLHASAVGKDGRAFIFLGESGSGKSTLSAFLSARGFDFISDDTIVVYRDGGDLLVAGSSESGWLFSDSYEALRLKDCARGDVRGDGKLKFSSVRPNDGDRRNDVLGKLFILEFNDGASTATFPEADRRRRIKSVQSALKGPPTPMRTPLILPTRDLIRELHGEGAVYVLSRPNDLSALEETAVVLKQMAAAHPG